MKRRSVLASTGLTLASAVAGCLAVRTDSDAGENGNENGTSDDSDKHDSCDPTADFERALALADIDQVPESVPVEFDVELTERSISPAGTGRLQVAVTNRDDTERQIQTPFYKGASDGDRRTVLYSLEAPDSPDPGDVPSCIEGPAPTQEYIEWTDEGPLVHTLAPDETGTDELLLVDDPTAEGCFPPGTYRFETTHSLAGTEFSWGFTLEITDCPTGEKDDNDTRRYGECPREVIPYDQFPTDVQAEIDAALDGTYEADRVFLRDTMDTTASFVSVDGEYYEATVSSRGNQEVLTLELVEPKVLPDTRPVRVELDRDERRTVSVELLAEDGTVLVDESRQVQPGAEVTFGRTDRVGTHELRVTVSDGDTEDEFTKQVTLNESRFSVVIHVEPDGIAVVGAVAELGICQFDW